jgi:hypothetical protein
MSKVGSDGREGLYIRDLIHLMLSSFSVR